MCVYLYVYIPKQSSDKTHKNRASGGARSIQNTITPTSRRQMSSMLVIAHTSSSIRSIQSSLSSEPTGISSAMTLTNNRKLITSGTRYAFPFSLYLLLQQSLLTLHIHTQVQKETFAACCTAIRQKILSKVPTKNLNDFTLELHRIGAKEWMDTQDKVSPPLPPPSLCSPVASKSLIYIYIYTYIHTGGRSLLLPVSRRCLSPGKGKAGGSSHGKLLREALLLLC
jgi:hypothetical protein